MKKIYSLLAAVLFAGSMFADSYVKVTSVPEEWGGDYLIVNEEAGVAFNGGLTTLDVSNNVISVSIVNGAIEATPATDSAKFTISATDAGFCVMAGDKFIGQTSYANGLKVVDTVIAHSLYLDANANAIMAIKIGNDSVTLRYNKASNQTRFRYYKTGQEAIQLYKRSEIEVPTLPTVAIKGSFDNWADSILFSASASGQKASFTQHFEAGNGFTFKLRIDGQWRGKDGDNNTSFWITRQNYYADGIESNCANDMKFVPDVTGDYTFTWTYATNTLSVKFPAKAQYEVADLYVDIEKGHVVKDDSIAVRGVITKLEFKPKNFTKHGSVNIYVVDATGAESAFEFYNCYSLAKDTFATSVPAYTAGSEDYAEFTSVTDRNNVTVCVGDTVVAKGKYTVYNNTHELNTGCFLTNLIHVAGETSLTEVAPEQKAVKFFKDGILYIRKDGQLYNAQGAVVR